MADDYDEPSVSPEPYDSSSESDVDSDVEVDDNLSATILSEIQAGVYPCLICTEEITSSSRVWSCKHCFRVYDLECISGWATKDSGTNPEHKWRCPACNVKTHRLPKRFSCWCGRVSNPRPNDLQPFSCGMLCQYKQKKCVHQCSSVCHPGPHPVCGAMGPILKCHCGNHESQWPCIMTPYDSGWRCDDECEVEVCDMGHKCGKKCHRGFCGKCKQTVKVGCYCGNHELEVPCWQKELRRVETRVKNGAIDADEAVAGTAKTTNGSATANTASKDSDQSSEPSSSPEFSRIAGTACSDITRKYYTCGHHYEDLACADVPSWTPSACPTDPSVITTCPCGKTTVSASRTKCTDPLPLCDNVCDKQMPCGHRCQAQCHDGACRCYAVVPTKCRCGHTGYEVPCAFAQSGTVPVCRHKCDAVLNCKKHVHREPCCPSEQAALRRAREVKKASRNGGSTRAHDDIMAIEPEHICTRPCNQLKKCGHHYCEALCHPGPCGTCYESTSDDLVCRCGRTVVEAPVRCGTTLPKCPYPCKLPKECGHPPENHTCHETGDCPKCTKFVERQCDCGLHVMKGVMCSQTRVSCGNICRVPKDKCRHPCGATCNPKCSEGIHAPASSCQYPCGKLRTKCPHRCRLKCHADKPTVSSSCDTATCGESVVVRCACGRLQRSVRCGASSLVESALWGAPLECDASCERAQRDLELKQALWGHVSAEEPGPEVPYSSFVMSVYAKQTNWCRQHEVRMREVAQRDRGTYEFARVALAPQRRFLAELAASYGLYSEIVEEEPSKKANGAGNGSTTAPTGSVVVAVPPSGVELPEMLIAEAITIRDEAAEKAYEVRLRREQAPYNGVVIHDVFFGISHASIETKLGEPGLVFEWFKESSCFVTDSERSEEQWFELMKQWKQEVRTQSLAFDVQMVYVEDGEIHKKGDKLPEREEEKGEEENGDEKEGDEPEEKAKAEGDNGEEDGDQPKVDEVSEGGQPVVEKGPIEAQTEETQTEETQTEETQSEETQPEESQSTEVQPKILSEAPSENSSGAGQVEGQEPQTESQQSESLDSSKGTPETNPDTPETPSESPDEETPK
ncbi:hypothetical protein DICA4_D19658 [Diutina catenulata]